MCDREKRDRALDHMQRCVEILESDEPMVKKHDTIDALREDLDFYYAIYNAPNCATGNDDNYFIETAAPVFSIDNQNSENCPVPVHTPKKNVQQSRDKSGDLQLATAEF